VYIQFVSISIIIIQ